MAGNAKETVKTWKELECLILTSHYAQVGNCDSDFFYLLRSLLYYESEISEVQKSLKCFAENF
jgi:hypothetical protein